MNSRKKNKPVSEKPNRPAEKTLYELEAQNAELRRLHNEKETNFHCFFNSIDDFLFVLDAEGRILQVNNTVLSRLGYSAEELAGQSVLMVHPAERRTEAGQVVANMLAGREQSCLIPIISKSGILISVETRISQGQWNGQPALFGVSKDISALKVSEEKLEKTFQATAALIAISTLREGIYIDVNEAFLHTLGYERQEVIGKSSSALNIFYETDVRERLMKILEEDGAFQNIEFQARTKTGGKIFGLLSCEIIDAAEGRLLVSTMTDVTDMKRLQEELLLASERMTLVLEASGAGIWDRDLKSNKVFVDEQWKTIRGYAAHELVDIHDEWRSRVHPSDEKRIQKEMDDALKTMKNKFEIEYRMRRKDGMERWIRAAARITRDQENKPVRLTGIDVDITDQKRLVALQQETETRLKDFAQAVPDISFVIDEDGRFIEVFGADETLLPLPGKNMRNRNVSEVYPAETAVRLMDDIKRALERKSMLRVEHIVEVRKGRLFFVGRVGPMTYIHEGRRLAAVVLQDFTERWKAESMLQSSYQLRRKSDFLNDLLLGNRELDTDALDIAAKMGLDFSVRMFCCIISGESLSMPAGSGKSVFSEMTAHKDMIIAGIGDEQDRIVWDCREGIGVVFLQREPQKDEKRRSLERALLLKETISRSEPDLEVAISVGDPASGADGLRKSFRQASLAMLAIRSKAGKCGKVSHFRDLGILQLLAQSGGNESSKEFVNYSLGQLIAYDREKGTGYLQTLELLLESNSLKEVGQTLFIHPNTVLFRRQRIEKLLSINLDDFETRIALAAAIKLHKLNK